MPRAIPPTNAAVSRGSVGSRVSGLRIVVRSAQAPSPKSQADSSTQKAISGAPPESTSGFISRPHYVRKRRAAPPADPSRSSFRGLPSYGRQSPKSSGTVAGCRARPPDACAVPRALQLLVPGREDAGPDLGDGDRELEVGRQRVVLRVDGPVVVAHPHLGATGVDHRLDRQHHAGLEQGAAARLAE